MMMKFNIIYGFAFIVFLALSVQSLKPSSKKVKFGLLPKRIKLEIPFNQSYTLKFKLKEHKDEISETEVVSEDRNGTMVVFPADKAEHKAVYKNKKYRALFTVTFYKKATVKNVTFIGSFYLKDKEYNLMPADYNEEALGDRVEEELDVIIYGGKYKLSMLKPAKKIVLDDDELIMDSKDNETYADMFKEIGGDVGEDVKISNQRGAKQNLIVELLLIIDVSTYQKFLRFSKNNPASAVSHLKFFYTHIMSAVNERYQGIQHPEFSWSLVVTALYIGRTAAEVPFSSVRREGGLFDGQKALFQMNDWVRKQVKSRRINWPSFDLTVLIHDLNQGGVLGQAFRGGVCSALPVGHMRNLGTHETIFIVSHELGHSIGSSHDASKECIPQHPFIMVPNSIGDSSKTSNEIRFSPCSIKQFETHVRNLNRANKNCMLNRPSHLLQPLNSKKNSKTKLGQNYNLDFQCRVAHGTGSSFCGVQLSGDALCKNAPCFSVKYNSCINTRNFRPMDGTPCGNRMWCIRGRCVADARAPTNNGNAHTAPCKDKVNWCSTYVRNNPTSCRGGDLKKTCCKACKGK